MIVVARILSPSQSAVLLIGIEMHAPFPRETALCKSHSSLPHKLVHILGLSTKILRLPLSCPENSTGEYL